MNIILKQDVDMLGSKFDVVTVKDGYARNFLIPQGLAVAATASNIKVNDEVIRQQAHKAAKAKETILEMLKEHDLVLKQETTHQVIPIAERSGAPLEIIVTPQWFIRTLDFKEQILEKGREITWKTGCVGI